jgi:SseB protein N-terminal domain
MADPDTTRFSTTQSPGAFTIRQVPLRPDERLEARPALATSPVEREREQAQDQGEQVRTDADQARPPSWHETTVSPAEDAARSLAVETALTAATMDATRIADLFETLRTAKLWLPLPDTSSSVPDSGAVELPTVSYLGSEFVPAYTSADLLAALARPGAPARRPEHIPHAVVQAADLARLLPGDIGIALNAGATESVPIYPPGVDFLAAEGPVSERDRISVGPLPAEPEELLAEIGAGLAAVPQAAQASAAWLSVRFSGEGMIISVTLDDPADAAVKDAVVAVLEQAAQSARHDAGYPIDVTFPGESEPDQIDRWIAACIKPFYRRD